MSLRPICSLSATEMIETLIAKNWAVEPEDFRVTGGAGAWQLEHISGAVFGHNTEEGWWLLYNGAFGSGDTLEEAHYTWGLDMKAIYSSMGL